MATVGEESGTKQCSKCGSIKSSSLFYRGVCKECKAEYNKTYAAKNRTLMAQKHREYQEANRARIKIQRAAYSLATKDVRAEKEKVYASRRRELYEAAKEKDLEGLRCRNRERMRAGIELISDAYVKDQLRGSGFKSSQITPELIELKRITLKTSRLCKGHKQTKEEKAAYMKAYAERHKEEKAAYMKEYRKTHRRPEQL